MKSAAFILIMPEFNTQLTLRIDWSEMDLFGHVNNVSFFKYIQAARVNYWELTGLNELYKTSNIGPTLAAVNCQFKKSLYYQGSVTIQTKVDWIKNSSLQLSHQLLNDKNEIAAEGQDVIVMFDYNTNEKVAIPKVIRNVIEKREGKTF